MDEINPALLERAMKADFELKKLVDQHRQLDQRIERLSRGFTDSLELTKLKKEKLKIKEEIVRRARQFEANTATA